MLREHQLPEAQLGLLVPSAQQGQSLTKRQRLSRELAHERAGVAGQAADNRMLA